MIALFGIYRLFLASMVGFAHVGSYHSISGAFAVYAFFLLSGYLITMVLQQDYGRVMGGIRAYFLNRSLRIYPLYWLALLMCFWVSTTVPQLALNQEIMIPRSLMEVLWNVIIFGPIQHTANNWRLLSVGWSLQTEVSFYLLLPLLVLRRRVFWCWMAFSLICLLACMFIPVPFADRYFSLWGASPAFATGSLIYVMRERMQLIPHWLGFMLIAALVGIMFYPLQLLNYSMFSDYYLVMILNAFVVIYLSRLPVARSSRLYRFDTFMGELSYPVFLFHIPVAEALSPYIGLKPLTLTYYLTCLPAIFLCAYVLHVGVERPIGRLRDRIRGHGKLS